MENNKNISVPQSGMIRDSHPSALEPNQYSFAMNANIEGEDGSVNFRQNEPSNIKCMEFDGYNVVGYKNDVSTNNTYFFLAHPTNNTSKVIFFESNEYANSIEDVQVGDGIDVKRVLGDRLEDSPERYYPTCGSYKVLIEDEVNDPCLNFSLAHPIKTIEIKAEKCGNVIYWTDGYNPPRWLSVEKALVPDADGDIWYHYHGYKICGASVELDRCKIACEKLRVFPLMDTPCIQAGVMEYGGSLRAGIRQYCVALCDQFGNETTNYHSLTGPVHVFDRNDILVKDGKWGARTNMGVRLDVSNLDKQSMYYKIGVLQKTVGYNGESQPVHEFLIEGIHPITEQTVYHLSDLDMEKTTLPHLSKKRPVYKTSQGITTSGDRLLQYGLTAEPEWNLQPVCNFLGHFLQWQTSVSLETLYQDGVACAKYAGYMRDEVYPFSISFITNTDYETAVFPLIPRPKHVKEAENVSNKEVDSILEYVPDCTGNDRKERWQFYNTAVNLSKKLKSTNECKNEIEVPRSLIVEKDIMTLSYPNRKVHFSFVPEYFPEDFTSYIENNPQIFCDTYDPSWDSVELCKVISGSDDIEAPEFPVECHDVKRINDRDVTTIPKGLIKDFEVTYELKDLNEMKPLSDEGIFGNTSPLTNDQTLESLFKNGAGPLYPEYVSGSTVYSDFRSYIKSVDSYACGDCTSGVYEIMVSIAKARRFYASVECTDGCSPDNAIDMPEIWPGVVNLINLSRHIGTTYVKGSLWESGKTQTRKAIRIAMDNWYEDYKFDKFSKQHLDYSRDLTYYNSTSSFFAYSGDNNCYYEKRTPAGSGNGEDITLEGECFSSLSDRTIFFFQNFVSKNAKWYKITRPDSWDDPDLDIREKTMLIEIYGTEKISPSSSSIDSTAAKYFRVSSYVTKNGEMLESPFDQQSGNNSVIFEYGEHHIFEIGSYAFKGNKTIYLAIDSMICAMGFAFGEYNCSKKYSWGHTYATCILPGDIGIGIRKKEVRSVEVFCSSITVRRAAYFEALCTSCGDTPINCDPRPYEFGDFGFYQSTERYPANFELYDSTKVRINPNVGNKKKKDIISKLTEYYGSPSNDNGGLFFVGHGFNYPEANPVFCQQSIRHYRFPDNIISPFCSSSILSAETEAYIYPLGIRIDESVVSAFLDIAVDSGLISQEQRDTITGYRIYRGDRTLSRGVLGAGIGFDMYRYKDDTDNEVLYANYPYNDLSNDSYNYTDESRVENIHHPYEGVGNTSFVFHSPDYHFNKPEMGTEIRIEGYEMGTASGEFVNVEDYPKYVLLGPSSIAYAKKMARIEALSMAFVAGLKASMEATNQIAGLATSLNLGVAWALLPVTLANVGKNYIQDYNRIKNDWLNILSAKGIPDNFANYYTSKAFYNTFLPVPSNQSETDTLRGINIGKYIDSGKYSLVSPRADGSNIVVNNRNRERSVFISIGKDEYLLRVPSNARSYDNSRIEDGETVKKDVYSGPVKSRGILISNVASPYIKMKRYMPAQYNGIENIKWISIGHCGKLSEDGGVVDMFGGDIYISRMSLKRKFPMFSYDAFGLADLLPFCMNDYRNVGFPKYFLDYETKESTEVGSDLKIGRGNNTVEVTAMPYRESSYKLNGMYGDWYLKGKFYNYFYGIPQFLVESEINCNERLMGVEPREGFFPAIGDYIDWTQQKNVPISQDEEFMISPIYQSRTELSTRMLPATYERKFWDCAYQRPNGVIWSRADKSENSMTDPWLFYKPLDVNEFASKFGKLIHLKGIESEIVLGRFENQVSLFNTVDVLKERMPQDVSNELGTGGLFAGRPMDYNHTDLGYSGSQSTEMISTEYGHFWVDAKRGQVFMVNPNGEGLQPLHPGMSHWLQEHLPFKILRYNIPNVSDESNPRPMSYDDVDNKFAGLGLSLGWDNRFKRVFVTKKDYIPAKSPSGYKYKDAKFYYNDSEVRLADPEYFVDVSFTLAYSCKNNEWISYYSFTPDYYIEHMSYFQTGKNFAQDFREVGLWSHLLTAQSYQVFYGKKYPFMIELPVREQYVNKILSNIQYRMESRRYHSEIDFAIRRSTGFNKAWVYNHRDNSGLLNLVPEEKNNWAQKLRYPKVERGGTSIIATEESEGWSFNDYFNRIKNNENNVPQWIKDVNDIEKEINGDAVYYNSIWKDRLRGDWFLVRYCNDDETRFKMIFRWQSNDEKIYR